MIYRTPLKVAIAQIYARNGFNPSEWYEKQKQSPFTDGTGPTSSWALPYNALNSQVRNLTGYGLVLFQIEWIAVLIDDFGIAPESLAFFSDNSRKSKLANGLGVRVVTEIEELQDMKVDYLLKNAPYDTGLFGKVKDLPFKNVGAHSVFSWIGESILNDGGIVFDVLPSNFMSLPTASGWRSWMLNNFEILNVTVWDNSQREVFDINMSDIITIVSRKTSKPKNNMVEWVAYNDAPFTVDLTRYDFWPIYQGPLSVPILDAVMQSKVRDIPHFNGGSKPNQIVPTTQHFISGNLTNMGVRQSANPRDKFAMQLGVMRSIKSPMWIGFDTQQECDLHYEWMATRHYAYVLALVKSTPLNQPFLFSLMGEHNFQDNNFNRHFNITPSQEQEIDRWYNSIK